MFLIALFLVLAVFFLAYIKPVFIALIIGILVTVSIGKLLDIYSKMTEQYTPAKKKAIIITGTAFVFLVVGAALFTGVVNISNNLENALDVLEDFNNKYNETADDMAEDLTNTLEDSFLYQNSDNELKQEETDSEIRNTETNETSLFGEWNSKYIIQSVLTSGGGILSSTTEKISTLSSTIFASCLIIPIMVGYYFKERGKLQKRVLRVVPLKYRDTFIQMVTNISNDMGTFAVVKLVEAIIITFLYCAGFYVSGLSHWLFAGVLMGVFNSVPYVGFLIPAIPVLVYAYMQGSDVMISTAGIIIIIQLFDFFFILPRMVMKTVNVSSFTAVILTLAGLKMGGIFGLVFAVPIYMMCKIILVASYKMLVSIYPDPPNHNESVLDEG